MSHISSKAEYAVVACAALAKSYGTDNTLGKIPKIAEEYGMPKRFLVQILIQLKGIGLVASTRGAAGGYQFIVDPAKVTVTTILDCINGVPPKKHESNADAKSPIVKRLATCVERADSARRKIYQDMTLADLAGIKAKKPKPKSR